MNAVAWEGVVIRPLDPPVLLEAHVAFRRETPTVAMKEFLRILKEVTA
jgi:hypothetical protein